MTSKLNIGWINHTFNYTKGGKEIINWQLIRGLLERGHEIDLVTHQFEELDHPRLRIHQVPMFGKSLGIHRWVFAKYAWKKIKKLNVGLIFTNGKTGFGDVVRLGSLPHKKYLENTIKAQNSKVKKLLTKLKKATNISDKLALYLEKNTFCFPGLKKIIVPSSLIKQEVISNFNCLTSEQVAVIHNGFDGGDFSIQTAQKNYNNIRQKYNVSNKNQLFLFVGHDFQRKGLKRAINFIKSSNETELLVVGRGNKLSIPKKMKSRVHWVGEVENPTPYYDAADVLILPSYSEGFGLVVLEALARGTYPIFSDSTGAGEILDEKWKGLVLNNFTFKNFEKIDWSKVFSREYKRKRREFTAQFSWKRMINKYEEVFYEVISTA